jgi:hypothetical protein
VQRGRPESPGGPPPFPTPPGLSQPHLPHPGDCLGTSLLPCLEQRHTRQGGERHPLRLAACRPPPIAHRGQPGSGPGTRPEEQPQPPRGTGKPIICINPTSFIQAKGIRFPGPQTPAHPASDGPPRITQSIRHSRATRPSPHPGHLCPTPPPRPQYHRRKTENPEMGLHPSLVNIYPLEKIRKFDPYPVAYPSFLSSNGFSKGVGTS